MFGLLKLIDFGLSKTGVTRLSTIEVSKVKVALSSIVEGAALKSKRLATEMDRANGWMDGPTC